MQYFIYYLGEDQLYDKFLTENSLMSFSEPKTNLI